MQKVTRVNWIYTRTPDESKGEFGLMPVKTADGLIRLAEYDGKNWRRDNHTILPDGYVTGWAPALEG